MKIPAAHRFVNIDPAGRSLFVRIGRTDYELLEISSKDAEALASVDGVPMCFYRVAWGIMLWPRPAGDMELFTVLRTP